MIAGFPVVEDAASDPGSFIEFLRLHFKHPAHGPKPCGNLRVAPLNGVICHSENLTH